MVNTKPVDTYVSIETGETIDIFEGDSIGVRRKRSLDYLMQMNKAELTLSEEMRLKGFEKFKCFSSFTKLNMDEFALWLNDLTKNEIVLFVQLSEYAQFGSNVLMKKNRKDKIRRDDIVRLSKTGRDATLAALKGLLDKLFLCEATDGEHYQYVMNPHLVFKGRYINQTSLRLFDGFIRRLEK
jgi:hypothetical protein